MNNYTKIKNMTPNQMAKFLSSFEKEDIVYIYCTECGKNENYCNDSDECPVKKEKMFLKWLNSECE